MSSSIREGHPDTFPHRPVWRDPYPEVPEIYAEPTAIVKHALEQLFAPVNNPQREERSQFEEENLVAAFGHYMSSNEKEEFMVRLWCHSWRWSFDDYNDDHDYNDDLANAYQRADEENQDRALHEAINRARDQYDLDLDRGMLDRFADYDPERDYREPLPDDVPRAPANLHLTPPSAGAFSGSVRIIPKLFSDPNLDVHTDRVIRRVYNLLRCYTPSYDWQLAEAQQLIANEYFALPRGQPRNSFRMHMHCNGWWDDFPTALMYVNAFNWEVGMGLHPDEQQLAIPVAAHYPDRDYIYVP